jgi:hypothetical protein
MAVAYFTQNGLCVTIFSFEMGRGEQTLKHTFIGCLFHLFHLGHFGSIDQTERPIGHVYSSANAGRPLWFLS